ncbi:MAG: amino acid ABC transporter permease [Clostridia bacterium]|jgi:amine acid ABC transporter, permease protein, 3-TM region, His/Glu/Gln/Arg/opine family|nr:amino acid ABC transporter permease [Clostridia bacterium]MBR5680844.1 amino acid ABC transporter permease [Clostridia bacterium]MCR5681526.1 amino acid ABC transporter permease [Clostridiales bacterium]
MTLSSLFLAAGGPFAAWFAKLHETFIVNDRYKLLIEGFRNTIILTLGALAIGLVIGTIVAVIKYLAEDAPSLRWAAFLCDVYLTVIRGVPMVVQLLIFYYIIFSHAKDGIPVAIVAFGVNSGAYMAELIRSGINAVDSGQMEAGRSLGMNRLQTMRVIILPQAIRYILPAIFNELIALLKETSIAGYVAEIDLTRAGNLIRNNTYDAINTLFLVALVYLTMVIILEQILKKLERRLRKGDKR